jgi:hypothetical protein
MALLEGLIAASRMQNSAERTVQSMENTVSGIAIVSLILLVGVFRLAGPIQLGPVTRI